ncbi:MAG: transposase [Lachnospiraceae bacterium]|nr:transposase [Lachnospiraceae bacterium]
MDNAPWHKKTKRLVQEEQLEEYSDILEDIEFIKLPPYSPDLNPIEQVWRITRKREHSQCVFR